MYKDTVVKSMNHINWVISLHLYLCIYVVFIVRRLFVFLFLCSFLFFCFLSLNFFFLYRPSSSYYLIICIFYLVVVWILDESYFIFLFSGNVYLWFTRQREIRGVLLQD